MSNLFNILFAPVFIVLLHYFEFGLVVRSYLIIAVLFFIYTFIKKEYTRELLMPAIYVIALIAANYFSSMEIVKFVPVTLSMIFFFLFLDATINQKHMILGFTKQFYRKKLSEAEEAFVKNGDGYWVVVTFVNTLIQIYVIYNGDNVLWAFYTSIGWYILFFVSLTAQIIYGKAYAVKMYYR